MLGQADLVSRIRVQHRCASSDIKLLSSSGSLPPLGRPKTQQICLQAAELRKAELNAEPVTELLCVKHID